jgi:hypothetical protein
MNALCCWTGRVSGHPPLFAHTQSQISNIVLAGHIPPSPTKSFIGRWICLSTGDVIDFTGTAFGA